MGIRHPHFRGPRYLRSQDSAGRVISRPREVKQPRPSPSTPAPLSSEPLERILLYLPG